MSSTDEWNQLERVTGQRRGAMGRLQGKESRSTAILLGAAMAIAAYPLGALLLEIDALASNIVLFLLVIFATERLYKGLRKSDMTPSALALVLAVAAMAMGYNAGLIGAGSLGLDMETDAQAISGSSDDAGAPIRDGNANPQG